MARQRTVSVKLPHLEKAFVREAEKELKKLTPKVGKSLQNQARENTRYKDRTGLLRKSTKWAGDLSILKRGNKRGITVKTNRPYDKFIIGGTYNWDADDFLGRATRAKKEPIYVQVFWAIQRAIKKVNR